MALLVSHLVAGFLPLDKGKVNEVHEGLAVSGEEGIFSYFLQSNLRASPTYALQKSSVTAKTVGDYRFLTLFQIPPLLLSLKTNVKSISPLNLKSQKRFCLNKRFFVKRKGRSKSKQARL